MDKKQLDMMNAGERDLLRAVYGRKLGGLDEEELVELHNRVRRARNKYSKLYRRQSAARVKKDKSRGKASSANTRTALKAEVFEDALATVSRRLARVAWQTSDQLKKERLKAARDARSPKGSASKSGKAKAKAKASGKALPREKKKQRTGASERASAQARAATRKGQAKRASKK